MAFCQGVAQAGEAIFEYNCLIYYPTKGKRRQVDVFAVQFFILIQLFLPVRRYQTI
jgi:hypothetical protein